MAFYPVDTFKNLTASTKPEMEQKLSEALADAYFPAGPIRYDSKQAEYGAAYVQTVVKLTNTDPQFIAAMAAAFKPMFDALQDAIINQLSTISGKLTTANNTLSTIATNTEK